MRNEIELPPGVGVRTPFRRFELVVAEINVARKIGNGRYMASSHVAASISVVADSAYYFIATIATLHPNSVTNHARSLKINYVFPILAASLWAGNTLVSKLAAGAISPGEIAFLRWLIAVLLMFPIAVRPLLRHRKTIAVHWWKLAVLGSLGGIVYQPLSYTAACYTSAINMGVIQALVPLITIVLASVAFRTAPSGSTLAGAVVSLAGVLIVISDGNIAGLISHGLNRGDAMMLLAASSMAVYNILLKRWHLDVPLIVSMFVQAVTAAIVLAPFYALSEKHPLTASTTSMIIYGAIGASIAAPMAWMAGAKRLGPARVSLFFNLVPIMTAALAIALLSEPFSYALLIGGALTLIGVAIVELMRQAKSEPQHSSEPINTMKVTKAAKEMAR